MNSLVTNTLANNMDTHTIRDTISGKEYFTWSVYNPFTCTTTSVCYPPMEKLETDSNKLKINIKKFQIKFNFNL